MTRTSTRSSRTRLPALLIAACVGGVYGASGCGRAESQQIDSETHWFTSCDTDIDCGAGSCECGICTTTCTTSADCSGPGVTGVECVLQSGACSAGAGAAGAAAAPASACVLPCVDDNDCSVLGGDAVCEGQRCEQRASSAVIGGAGGSGNTTSVSTELCDGSEDVRFVWTVGGGFVSTYYAFTSPLGSLFLAVDGQCRFWRRASERDIVVSGTLTADDAASFANAIGYGRIRTLGTFEDPQQCPDAGLQVLWTPSSRLSCICGCGDNPSSAGWQDALRTMSDGSLDGWLGTAQPLTGPARMALISFNGPVPNVSDAAPWPLGRAPEEAALYPMTEAGTPFLEEYSGVEVSDPTELALLRAARADYAARVPGSEGTPLLWTNPATQSEVELSEVGLNMLLRDEPPSAVRDAIQAARSAP